MSKIVLMNGATASARLPVVIMKTASFKVAVALRHRQVTEEKLPRIEAGCRFGIPKTTACDLFVRFRKACLSWPLPPRINAQNLDKRLYRQASRKSSIPVATAPCKIPVGRKRPRRPNFPRDFKIALVAQSMQPGISVAQLARENNHNDNLLFNWRRRYPQISRSWESLYYRVR